MKVRMNIQISGARDDAKWPPIGGELVVSDREGAELCAQGYATPVTEPEASEKRPAAKRAEKRA